MPPTPSPWLTPIALAPRHGDVIEVFVTRAGDCTHGVGVCVAPGESELSARIRLWHKIEALPDVVGVWPSEDARARELAEIEELFDATTATGLRASRAA